MTWKYNQLTIQQPGIGLPLALFLSKEFFRATCELCIEYTSILRLGNQGVKHTQCFNSCTPIFLLPRPCMAPLRKEPHACGAEDIKGCLLVLLHRYVGSSKAQQRTKVIAGMFWSVCHCRDSLSKIKYFLLKADHMTMYPSPLKMKLYTIQTKKCF